MPTVHHLVRASDGSYDSKKYNMSPMEFVIKHIPDGTPFQIYIDGIGAGNDVTEDFDALREDAEFFVVESPGGGAVSGVFKLVGVILNPILKLLLPSAGGAASVAGNQQGASPNNSLTDRNNKPRPYERTYDICGTVQSIPNNLMQTYKRYDSSGNLIEYGYYDVGRGPLDTPVEGITDGDTKLKDISGSAAAVYGPYTSPNSGTPQVQIGAAITEGLYVTIVSNQVDGMELKAYDNLSANIGSIAVVSRNGSTATITDASGDSGFSTYMKVGSAIELLNIYVDSSGAVLSGIYTITSISDVDVSFTVDPSSSGWPSVPTSPVALRVLSDATTGPYDKTEASFTDWFVMNAIKTSRVVGNFGANNGIYKENNDGKFKTSTSVRLEYQALDGRGVPYGPVYAVEGAASGQSTDATGITLIGELPEPSAFRARARRTSATKKLCGGR